MKQTHKILLLSFFLLLFLPLLAYGEPGIYGVHSGAAEKLGTATDLEKSDLLDKKISIQDGTDMQKIYEDAAKKLWPRAILKKAKEKLDERTFYSPDYRYLAGQEIIMNFWLEYEPSPNFRHDARMENIIHDLVKDDLVRSLEYGLRRQGRDLLLYDWFKRWGKGLSTMRIDQPSSTNSFIIETPSYSRRLDPFEESKAELDFECRNIIGDASILFAQRIRCSEARNEVSISESLIYRFRIKPGLNADIHANNNSGIIPTAEPYIVFKYGGYDTKLSYTYPYPLTGIGSRPKTFLPNVRDKIFDLREAKERIELDVTKTFTRHFVLRGNYRYERVEGESSFGVGPKLSLFPYLASGTGDINVNSMAPLFTLDIGRVIGTYVVGIRGTAARNPNGPGKSNNSDWDYEALFTVSKIWSPYEQSFFEDIHKIFRTLF